MHYSDTRTSAPTWSGDTSLCSYVQQLPPRLGLECCISCYVVCFSKLHLHYLDTRSEQHANQSISEWWGDDSAYLGRMVITVHHFCLKIERSFACFFDFNPSWEKKVYFVCLYIYICTSVLFWFGLLLHTLPPHLSICGYNMPIFSSAMVKPCMFVQMQHTLNYIFNGNKTANVTITMNTELPLSVPWVNTFAHPYLLKFEIAFLQSIYIWNAQNEI